MIIIKISILYFIQITHTLMISPQGYPASPDNELTPLLWFLHFLGCQHIACDCQIDHNTAGSLWFIDTVNV